MKPLRAHWQGLVYFVIAVITYITPAAFLPHFTPYHIPIYSFGSFPSRCALSGKLVVVAGA